MSNSLEANHWVTIKQAAQWAGVHQNTIRNKIDSGQLKAYRLGTRIIRILFTDLESFFQPVTKKEKPNA